LQNSHDCHYLDGEHQYLINFVYTQIQPKGEKNIKLNLKKRKKYLFQSDRSSGERKYFAKEETSKI